MSLWVAGRGTYSAELRELHIETQVACDDWNEAADTLLASVLAHGKPSHAGLRSAMLADTPVSVKYPDGDTYFIEAG